jgi:glycosyltransferase involved in cell wall biosynthesis
MAEAPASEIRLLLVSYLFPPSGGIAVQRALSLAKYLPEQGFRVHVLKARNAAGPADDPALLEQVPPSVTIHEAFTPEIPFALRQRIWKFLKRGKADSKASAASSAPARPGGWKAWAGQLARRIFNPEPEILWVPFALRKARGIVRKHGIQAMMVTAPPFSAFLVGTALKREFPDLKFISDFRDEWLSFYLKDFDFQNSAATRRRAEEIERETVEASDLVVAVTESSLVEIRNRYPEVPDSRFACIHNGYDPKVIQRVEDTRAPHDRVIVSHIGTVYKTASPRYYLDALDGLPDELRSRFETRFIGRISDEEKEVLQNRKSQVRIIGFLPQKKAMEQVAETDYLLLTMTNDISLPGKLFEYLALGKPILALSRREGEVFRILERTRAGWCVDFADPTAIGATLAQAAASVRTGSRPDPDWEEIRKFERPRLVRKYGDLIRSVVEPASGAPPRERRRKV